MAGPRILFLYPTLAVGGAERQLALLVPPLRERGFQPLVATLGERGRYFEELDEAGIRTHHLGLRTRFDVPGLARAYRLWRFRPDVVFTQGTNAQVVGSVIAARARASHVTAEHAGAGLRRAPHRSVLARAVARAVTCVVCVSSSQVPDLRGLGYRSSAIRVIANGIPQPVLTRSRDEMRRELGLDADDAVLVLVAALRPEKRAELFVDAVVRARRSDSRIRGVVVGGGPELSRIRERAVHTDGAVLVMGERPDALDLMSAADAVCLTSYAEGLPMTVLEAMAVGRPVIATAVGGLPDAVVHGETGLLVDSGDPDAVAEAMLELASSPARRRAMGDAALARFESLFTVDRMVDHYAQMFTSLASAR